MHTEERGQENKMEAHQTKVSADEVELLCWLTAKASLLLVAEPSQGFAVGLSYPGWLVVVGGFPPERTPPIPIG